MELSENFNRKIVPLVNSSETLSDWFERNEEIMSYYEMTHAGCLHFEGTSASNDVKVLGRMANGCLTCLETQNGISDEEKVKNAILSMAEVYERDKELLSDGAKESYYIDPQEKQKGNVRR